jgi:aerobic carbon-monoxide dehydrogenase medium subunit
MQPLAVHRSRKLIPEFVLHRPAALADACELLSEFGDKAAVIAGGIDVISRMKTGAGPAHVVSIGDISDMRGIRLDADCIRIGAAVTHREIETDPLLRSRMPSVSDYVAALGNIRIRCQGTIGGNVMADESGYEMLALLLVLDAFLNFCDPANGASRAVSARDFARAGTPARSFGLLTSISIPLAPILLVWNRDLRPMIALVAGVQWSNSRLAAGGAALVGVHRRAVWGPVAFDGSLAASNVHGAASTLAGDWARALPNPDLAGGSSPGYARRVGAVMLRRALTDAGLHAGLRA